VDGFCWYCCAILVFEMDSRFQIMVGDKLGGNDKGWVFGGMDSRSPIMVGDKLRGNDKGGGNDPPRADSEAGVGGNGE